MDLVVPLLTPETMGTFTFHGWLIVEIFTDEGWWASAMPLWPRW
jgi:hypothetical protein